MCLEKPPRKHAPEKKSRDAFVNQNVNKQNTFSLKQQ